MMNPWIHKLLVDEMLNFFSFGNDINDLKGLFSVFCQVAFLRFF
jgi:hypothetical protein